MIYARARARSDTSISLDAGLGIVPWTDPRTAHVELHRPLLGSNSAQLIRRAGRARFSHDQNCWRRAGGRQQNRRFGFLLWRRVRCPYEQKKSRTNGRTIYSTSSGHYFRCRRNIAGMERKGLRALQREDDTENLREQGGTCRQVINPGHRIICFYSNACSRNFFLSIIHC